MLRQFLQEMKGVDFFGILSMVIFLVFFTLVVIHTMKIKKEDESAYSKLPLEEDQDNPVNNHD